MGEQGNCLNPTSPSDAVKRKVGPKRGFVGPNASGKARGNVDRAACPDDQGKTPQHTSIHNTSNLQVTFRATHGDNPKQVAKVVDRGWCRCRTAYGELQSRNLWAMSLSQQRSGQKSWRRTAPRPLPAKLPTGTAHRALGDVETTVNLRLHRGPTGEAHVAHLLRSKLGKRLADWAGFKATRPIWSGVRCGGESWPPRQ
jgi:hypothetical protein